MNKLTLYNIGKITGIIFMSISIIIFAYFMIMGASEINIWRIIGLFWLGSSINWQSAYYEVVRDEE